MRMIFEQSISENSVYDKLLSYASTALFCIAGSIFMGLMSQFTLDLPFTPVPLNLQTFALFLLIIAQGKKKATYSILLYLAQASMGLPVLSGGSSNPLWIILPSAGYLLGFVGCSYVAGYILEMKQKPGFAWTLLSLFCGQVVLYLMGTAYLSWFVGVNQAYALGVAPFLFGAIVKVTAASCTAKPVNFVKSQLFP